MSAEQAIMGFPLKKWTKQANSTLIGSAAGGASQKPEKLRKEGGREQNLTGHINEETLRSRIVVNSLHLPPSYLLQIFVNLPGQFVQDLVQSTVER